MGIFSGSKWMVIRWDDHGIMDGLRSDPGSSSEPFRGTCPVPSHHGAGRGPHHLRCCLKDPKQEMVGWKLD